MRIEDIVRSDVERLFIIDRECFVIYTGNSLEDDKPFIRIGNYIDLPVDLIPLVENIVITDLIIGNPSHEQFNIDIKLLSTNRYIGSHQIVKKYLDFQKNIVLDLTNAAIVEIEKDVPFLSKEKDIPDRHAGMGIFYNDGNFRINRGKTGILDLKDRLSRAFDDSRMHDHLSDINKGQSRYGGAGLVIINNNPLFYRNGYFSFYHFPRNYYESFHTLQIDPSLIREILLPSSNFIHVTKFLKWKNGRKGRIKLFSDFREQIDIIQKLFADATILRRDFSGFSHDTGDGLNIKNYSDSFNIRLSYRKVKPSMKDISVAYIKGPSGIPAILKDRLDAIFIHYSVYEEANLLLKSAAVPLAVINDGHANVAKLRDAGVLLVYPEIQYDFAHYESMDDLIREITPLFSRFSLPGETSPQEMEKLCQILSGENRLDSQGLPELAEIYNLTTFLKIALNGLADRKTAATVKKALQEAENSRDRDFLHNYRDSIRIQLAFYQGGIYDFLHLQQPIEAGKSVFDEIRPVDKPALQGLPSREEREFYLRILEDRERLRRLLSLYAPAEDQSRYQELQTLKEAIEDRKKILYQADVREETEPARRGKPAPWKRWIALLLVAVSLGFISLFSLKEHHKEEGQRQKERIELEKRIADGLIKKYNIRVTDTDIFRYANEVAVKNGYKPMNFQSLREKNPNWIYPGNIFTLMDGQRVEVVTGDTLWDIAHKKLMEKNIAFYKLIEQVTEKLKTGGDISKELKEAKRLSFSKTHARILADLERK